MKIDKDLQDRIQELQSVEQNLQNLLLQKQAFQIELNELESAVEETEKSSGEIYKIVSQVMLKSKKEDILKELKEKKDIINLRIKAIERQEQILRAKLENFKREIEDKFKEKAKK